MIKPLILIPARGGSKGVPRKNIKELGGKPLIYWTIEAARQLFDDDIICVSTDDLEIKETVELIGLNVPFLRPEHLASDTAGSHEVLLHAVQFYESRGYYPNTIILLQPTSPFRTATHIKKALREMSADLEMIASVKETTSNPYYVLGELDSNGYWKKIRESQVQRRQDLPKVYELNGAIYIISVSAIKEKTISEFTKVRVSVMDSIASHDIDTSFDWKMAELIISSTNK